MTSAKIFGSPDLLALKDILRPVLGPLAKVENRLKSVGGESDGILLESSQYVLAGGGKRLRAALVFFCSSIRPRGESGLNPVLQDEAVVDVAASVELI